MPRGRDALDRRAADVDQFDVRPVVGLVVADVDAGALHADEVPRAEQLGGGRVVHDLADLPARELLRRRVRLGVGEDVREPPGERADAAVGPAGLERAVALFGVDLERPARRRHHRDAGIGLLGLAPALRIGRDHRLELRRIERPVLRRHRVVGGALEDVEVRRLARDLRDRLDRGRARADHPDPQAAEVDALVRPLGGVVPAAAERLKPGDVGPLHRRQVPDGEHAGASRHPLAAPGGQRPGAGVVVEHGAGDGRAERDIAAQVEAVGDVLEVAQDLGLRGVALRPPPLGQQLRREGVGVVDALDVAARARVPVPVPGAADVVAPLEGAGAQPEGAQAMEQVEAREAGADDRDIELGCFGLPCRCHWSSDGTKAGAAGGGAPGRTGAPPLRRVRRSPPPGRAGRSRCLPRR